MKYFLLPIITVVLFLTDIQAQQERQFTQFMRNKLVLNPAYAGSRDLPSVSLLYRNQWMGYEGRPESKLISFDAPLFARRVGIGVTLANHTIGIMEDWNATLAYSYNIKFNEKLSLRFGIHGMIRYLGLDFSDESVFIRDMDDPSIQFIAGEETTQWKGNVGIGAYLMYNKFYFGVSVPRIYPNTIGFNPNNLITAEEKPHYYAMSGIQVPLGYPLELQFDVLAKYVENAPFDVDFNTSLILYEKIHAGISYRLGGDGSGESVDLVTFFQITNQIGLGLSYDYPLTEVADQSDGSLEALLRIDLEKRRGDLANPRFF